MSEKNQYQQPMEPFPSLVPFCNKVKLSGSGLEIFYFESGARDNPTILLIHGLGDEADTWRHIIQPLAEKNHVIALDLPGFGRSDKPNSKYTPQFFLEALIELIDQLSIKKAILMGSSLGGILAHSLALTHSEYTQSLILVDGGLLQTEPMGDVSLRLMGLPLLGEWFYTRLRKDPDAAFDSLGNVYADLHGLPDADREFLYTRVNKRVWDNGQRRAYFSTLRSLTPWVSRQQSTLIDQLSQVEVPTLVIRGAHDPLFSEANALGIIEAQPYAELATIDGSGHLPHQEHPETFLKVVVPWLKVNCQF